MTRDLNLILCAIMTKCKFFSLNFVIGAREAKPLSSGWCENRKFGSLHGWLVGWVIDILYYVIE